VRTHATAVLERKGRIGPRCLAPARRAAVPLAGWWKRQEQHPTGGVEAVIGNSTHSPSRSGRIATANTSDPIDGGAGCVASNKCNQSHWVRAGIMVLSAEQQACEVEGARDSGCARQEGLVRLRLCTPHDCCTAWAFLIIFEGVRCVRKCSCRLCCRAKCALRQFPCALHRRSNIFRYCTREESALPQTFDYFSRTCVKAFPLFPFPLRSVPFPVKSPHGYPLIIFIFESKQMRTDELGPL
jgi:hypothetical protein